MPTQKDVIADMNQRNNRLQKDLKSENNQREAADQHVQILMVKLADESDRCDRQQERLNHRALHIRRLERLLAFYLGDPE